MAPAERGGSIFRGLETAIRTGPSENPGAPYWPGFSDEQSGRITLAVSGLEKSNRLFDGRPSPRPSPGGDFFLSPA
jgi:hypothetical protein